MRQQAAASGPEHDQKRDPDQCLKQRHEHAGGAGQADVALHVLFVQAVEVLKFRIFLDVGADYADPCQILLHTAADIGEHALDLLKSRVNHPAKQHHNQADQRGGD